MTESLSVDLPAPIAQGRTAEIYPWRTDKVLKLYRPGFEGNLPQYEAYIARAVHAAGVASPAVGELLQVNGRTGLEYERLAGRSLLELIFSRPWRAGWAGRQCAEVQAAMHTAAIPGLPAQRQRLAAKIQAAPALPANLRASLLERLESLPDANRLCHGDFHPGNLILSQRGPVVIDWVDAVSGHPLADIARTALLVNYSGLPAGPSGWFIHLLRTWFYRTFTRRYFQLADGSLADIQAWLPVVAAARLEEGIQSEEARLLQLAQA